MLLFAAPAGAQTTVDYDADDDQLIEIDSPAKLNAIRHDLDGDGLQGSVTAPAWANYIAAGAFPNPDSGQCPGGCLGYELTADLDLSGYANWNPIGGIFDTTFDGNGHSVSGLAINRAADVGLFGWLGANGILRNIGVIAPNITLSAAAEDAGGLAAGTDAGSLIHSSFVAGGSITLSGGLTDMGGLVGQHSGTIRASYSTAALNQTDPCTNCNTLSTGGLVGDLAGGTIIASYAAGPNNTTGGTPRTGGFVGEIRTPNPMITDSYCNSSVMVVSGCIGEREVGVSVSDTPVTAYTTRQLKRPIGYTGIYANWNIDLSDPADGVNDDPWDFGTHRNYPLLKIDQDGNGVATCEEFSGQPCYREPAPPPYNPAHDHPEIYTNARHQMATSCAVETTGAGDDAISTSTLTFDLGDYTRPLTLALSLWDGTRFRSLQSQGITMPELRQEGRTATVEVVTDPAQTRFRLDSEYGLNLVLGYADCHTDDP